MEYKLKNYKLAGEKAQFLYDEIELIDDQENMDAFNISKKTEKQMEVKITDDFSVLPAPIKSVCMVWAGQDIKKSEVHIEPEPEPEPEPKHEPET
tara:strand:- start:347 stop:631 length:285 start_codon:yes stop_codon:yes gene_type:complete